MIECATKPHRHSSGAPVVPIDVSGELTLATRERLVALYNDLGFCFFDVGQARSPKVTLLRLAKALSLGDAYIPPLYREPDTLRLYDEHGYNEIRACEHEHTVHPVFQSSRDLELHTDGTLEPLGKIRTSVLFCMEPAISGGETILFRAADAFETIRALKPDLALALQDEHALTRHATVNGSNDTATGPVFAVGDSEIMCRYCRTDRDVWHVDRVPQLASARTYIDKLAQPESPFTTIYGMKAGQGVIIANEKVSHGRFGYKDCFSLRRLFCRALYLNRVQLN